MNLRKRLKKACFFPYPTEESLEEFGNFKAVKKIKISSMMSEKQMYISSIQYYRRQ
jgi:hypothetical protein